MAKPITYYVDLSEDIAEAIKALDPDQTIDLITDIVMCSSPNKLHGLGDAHRGYILSLPPRKMFALIRGISDCDVPDDYPSPWERFVEAPDK